MSKTITIYVYNPVNKDILNNAFDGLSNENPLKDPANHSADIRDINIVGNICTGFLANLRLDNLPHLAKINSTKERKLPKDDDEALLEKSHFLYSKLTGNLFFQANAKAFRSADNIATILTNRTNYTISLNPVLTRDAHQRLMNNQQSIYRVEIDMASPDLSLLGDSSIERSISILASQVQKVKLNISNDRRMGKFLDMPFLDIFRRVHENHPTKFNVYSSELDSPIDLVLERQKFKKKVAIDGDGYINSQSVYEKLEECRRELTI